jgi:hypothetical protein
LTIYQHSHLVVSRRKGVKRLKIWPCELFLLALASVFYMP